MKCPSCGHTENRVLETRMHKEGDIRRRRECLKCGSRFNTLEGLLLSYPYVVKKDGRREPFNLDKLRKGILIACKKRPVSLSAIEALVGHISSWAQSSTEKEVGSKNVGQKVVEGLKQLDDVAYVRFASVYKSFQDVNEFVESLSLEQRKPHIDREC